MTIQKAVNAGRYKDGIDGCCCAMPLVKPDSSIFGCGCNDSPLIGSVENGIFDKFKDFSLLGGCSKVLLNKIKFWA